MKKTQEDLAILGGSRVKENSYPTHTTMIDEKEESAVLEVLRSQHLSGFSARPGDRFLGGEYVRLFEKNLAKKFMSSHAVTFNSATSGLHAAMYAAGVKAGDEVITSPFTMTATASSIMMCNATPIFCDIEESTFGINPELIEEKITERTKAILVVNIFGHGASLVEISEIAKKHGIALIEDSAQAPMIQHGDKICGHYGDIGVFSLNYHKAIQTGEGGFAISNDQNLVDRMRFLRNHGEVVIGPANRLDMIDMIGFNYRMTEIEASIGNVQLDKLDYLNEVRIGLALELKKRLGQYEFISAPDIKKDCSHGFYLFPMKFLRDKIGISREIFTMAMQNEGISIGAGYVLPVHLQPIYQLHAQLNSDNYDGHGLDGLKSNTDLSFSFSENADYRLGTCPVVERMHFDQILTTDICKYPNSENDIDDFCLAIEKILNNLEKLKSANLGKH